LSEPDLIHKISDRFIDIFAYNDNDQTSSICTGNRSGYETERSKTSYLPNNQQRSYFSPAASSTAPANPTNSLNLDYIRKLNSQKSNEATFQIFAKKIKLANEELCEHINDKIEKSQLEIIHYVDASIIQVREKIMTTIKRRFNKMVEVLRERHVETTPQVFTPQQIYND
jgi:hypothetical protein